MTRDFLARRGFLALLIGAASTARAQDGSEYLDFLFGPMQGTRPGLAAPGMQNVSTREEILLSSPEPPGTILIDTSARRLYFVEPGGRAQSYHVGIGSEGFGWTGTETISAKREWPDWRPPASMRARRPDLPTFVPGGPDNPMGARALYLGQTLYRIHGTNEPETVGSAASSGCFRLTNTDIIDLYERVRIGAKVRVY